MNCPKCNNVVSMKQSHCDRCGQDVGAYKSLVLQSNRYYNEGLSKAKVRDLSGAILVLNISLEKNKRNTDARNLLGLVYYEVGETVSALTEWVISKHFQADSNDADSYIASMQSNQTKLEGFNQTIKKYNLALNHAKNGNEDLAIIQLKKVVSLNPKFVKGIQLLALLYMKNKEYDKAMKALTKASKVDISNTRTLRYMKEIDEITGESKNTSQNKSYENERERSMAVDKPMYLGTNFKEDKPNLWPIVSLFIGAIMGALVVFFLVIPANTRGFNQEMIELKNEHTTALNKKDYTITTLEEEKVILANEIEDLKKTMSSQEIKEYDEAMFDTLFEAAIIYSEEVEKGRNIDYMRVAESLLAVDPSLLEREGAISLYNKMKTVAFLPASKDKYDEGHKFYTNRKYEDAERTLLEAYAFDETNVNTIYFIARTYHQVDNKEKALEYYNILVDNFPDTERAREARSKIRELEN